jgi:hypothetical protein
MAIADAVSDDDLLRLGAALKDASFVTAASGLALALPANWGFTPTANASRLPHAAGRKAIVAGSCSTATLAQVRHFCESGGLAPVSPRDLDGVVLRIPLLLHQLREAVALVIVHKGQMPVRNIRRVAEARQRHAARRPVASRRRHAVVVRVPSVHQIP